jgi:hypothetical protein
VRAALPVYGVRAWHPARTVGVSPYHARINGESLTAHQTFGHATAQYTLEDVTKRIAVAESTVAILGECRVIRNTVFQSKATEPAIGQIQVDLFAQASFRANTETVANDQHADHQRGINRTAAPGGPPFYAYSTNYLVDLNAAIIVDVEATPAYRPDEVDATKTMIDRVEERFDIKPDRLVGDTAYGTAEMLGWMVNEKAIEPHVPVWDKTQRTDETLSSSDFQWNEQTDEYRCPQGHALRKQRREFQNPRTHITKAGTIIYRASQSDCATCPMKARCCPNTPRRKIARSLYESARDMARAIAKTDEYKQSRKDRKKVEMLFAHLKRIMKLDRLRLRGLSGAKDEFLMAATVQNLRRMAKWLAPDTQNAGLVPA